MEVSHQCTGNFILIMELRKKIFTFRDIIDLPPCDATESINELVSRTIEDLHKFHPDSISRSQLSEIKGASIDKVLVCYCDALISIGDSLMMNQEWMDKVTFDNFSNIQKLTSENLENLDMMDEDEQSKDNLPASAFGKVLMASYSESNTSCCTSPITPTSVLPPQFMGSLTSDEFTNISCASPLLRSLRVQAVGKLNPIDIKRLSFHMPTNMEAQGYNTWNLKNNEDDEIMNEVEAEGKSLNQRNNVDGEMIFEMEASSNSEGTKAAKFNDARDCCMENGSPESEMAETTLTTEAREFLMKSAILSQNVAPAPPPIRMLIPHKPWADVGVPSPPCDPLPPPMLQPNIVAPPSPPPPPPPFVLQSNVKVQLPPFPPPLPQHMLQPNIATAAAPLPLLPLQILSPLLPPPPPMSLPNIAGEAGPPNVLPSPPHPLMKSGTVTGALPPPPPPMISSKGSMPLPPPPPPPPPPPMAQANGAAPPPPPPPPGTTRCLRPKKAQTKLRRSNQMCNLYRFLKGKVEGGNQNIRSAIGRKGSAPSSNGGKQGMADALAEMTKRSAYFQKIREDVQKYAKAITELKTVIITFKNKDMTELIKFHKQVESVLEQLTDETQVLARFQGFPQKKLEALRTAAALYSKLNGIAYELQNWKIITPLGQLLDKTERYFNKIKGEMDALERTKDEESKKFQSHNIHFDFHIIVQIKESLVDVSSNCMELALKERRQARTAKPNKANAKMLWRAFQFAFRVYSFAGGHDDRADKLTRELAHEIETDPQHQ
ncbi:hypothetical protein P3X46_020370 [Hevea brasiliensis]|uniref:Hydroxyproline-rich glycoprotein family protein n=1 Tax=Hevea brasiliensis TaxID=3981 RepID=A0ABQ9LQM3_HEVBR|nr:hypothetical protein P3X46_020370 [Hevea brasiliensis]